MKRPARKERRHFGLLRMFILVLFASGLIISAITCLGVYILVWAGVLNVTEEALPSTGNLMLFFSILSVPVSMAVAAAVSKFALKSVRNLIASMNQLASGDFKTRVNVGRFMRRYPAFVGIAKSFNQMAQELESTEMLREDFINNFSHEFKTPIVSITGFAQLLRHGNLPREQQLEYLAIIEEESKRLSSMATNVLTLTNVENQNILTDVTEYNLSEQLRSCILLLESKWSQKDIDLQLELGEYVIHAEQELLKQVWINLLDNAVKFAPRGGLLQVRIEEQGESLLVHIRNTGSQIPPESIGRIFNKFYQADESHSTQGNGVGLAIVKRVVDLHSGSIHVVSENMDTTFTVELPK